MSMRTNKPGDLPAGVYWYVVPGQSPKICEKREGEPFVRFTNGSRQGWLRKGEGFEGPVLPPLSRAPADEEAGLKSALLVFPLQPGSLHSHANLPVAAAVVANEEMLARIFRAQTSGKGDVLPLYPGRNIALIESMAFNPDGTLARVPGVYDPESNNDIKIVMLDGIEDLDPEENNGRDVYDAMCTLSQWSMDGPSNFFLSELDTKLALNIVLLGEKLGRMPMFTFPLRLQTVIDAFNGNMLIQRMDNGAIPSPNQ